MAQTIEISLKLTLAQRNAIKSALTTLETMVDSAKYQTLLGYWEQMDDTTQQHIIDRAPLFARLLTLSSKLPRQ